MIPGEIHLAIFPFGGTVGAKPHPVWSMGGIYEAHVLLALRNRDTYV
jgi:hypothetical protein